MRCVSYTRTTSCKSSESIPTDIIQQQNEQIQKYIQSHGWLRNTVTEKGMITRILHLKK